MASDVENEAEPARKRVKLDDGPARPAALLAREPVRFAFAPLNPRFFNTRASIKQPREIAHFSYDDDHEYHEDERSITYYYPPRLNVDLREGFENFVRYEDKEDPHLDSLLKTLASKEKKTGEKIQADFVTWRGMMTKIMTAPFDKFAEFDMLATLYDGTVYIEENFKAKTRQREAEAERNQSSSRPSQPNRPTHDMMTYWGYKFETLSMLPAMAESVPDHIIQNRPSANVSNRAQHCSIVRTAFGPNSLILGGEVDGLFRPKSKNKDDPIPWVELKTSECLPWRPQHHDILKYERKLLKFWAQSFLLGVEKVIVGFRTKEGRLETIDQYETRSIPGMVRRSTQCWDGNACINFADEFLGFLKRTITEEGVYNIRLKRNGDGIWIEKMNGEEGTGGIVSKEFLDWRAKHGQPQIETPATIGAHSNADSEKVEVVRDEKGDKDSSNEEDKKTGNT